MATWTVGAPRDRTRKTSKSRKRMSTHSDVAFTRCAAETVSPLARRLVAIDGGGLRSAGLRTYIVGHGEVALIDPDPASGPLMRAILEATEGERISHIVISHSHGRRSPLGAQLAERFGADVVSGAMGLRDRELIYGLDWTLEAIATPGHTPDHFAFALAEEDTVFCGDLVSGWTPEVATPPGGDLSALLASIELILSERFELLLPALGPRVSNASAFLHECLHDAARCERRIAAVVDSDGPTSAWRLAKQASSALRGIPVAEAHAILAHLVRMQARGDLTSTAPLSLFTPFTLAPRSNSLVESIEGRRGVSDRCSLGISRASPTARLSARAPVGDLAEHRSAP